MLNTSFVDQERARRSITKFLSESIVATEPVALMALNASGVTLIHDFTTEPGVLAIALKQVGGELPLNQVLQPVPLMVYRGRMNPMEEAAALQNMEFQNQRNRVSGTLGISITLACLRELGEAFAGIPGRKSLIWATGGVPFPADDSHYVTTWMSGLSELYQETWDAMNRADMAIYPLDVEGLVNYGYRSTRYGAGSMPAIPFRTSVYEIENFAKMTGGRMCYVKTEIGGCFREAAADSSEYYLLGFYPEPDPKHKGWRKMAVRVERNDAKVLARTSYYTGETKRASAGRDDDILMSMKSPLDYTGLPLTVKWTGNRENAGKKSVGFQFRLAPGDATVDESDGNHVSMDFAAAAISPKGNVEARFAKQLDGRIGEQAAARLKGGLEYLPGELELAPGEYMVRFIMRDNLSGRMGSISTALTVP